MLSVPALNAKIVDAPDSLKEVCSHGDDATYMPAEGAFTSVGKRSIGTWYNFVCYETLSSQPL